MNFKPLYDLYRISILASKRNAAGGKSNLAKPILLLVVLDGIENNWIHNNKIYYDDLVKPFEAKLSEFQPIKTPLKYPFFYLQHDGYWHLKSKVNNVEIKRATPSDKYLRDTIEFAYFDNALWDITQCQEIRDMLKRDILGFYFDHDK